MNKLIILFLVLVNGISHAQDKHAKAVEKVVEEFRLALISGDSATLERYVAPELSYGHSSGLIENKTEFISKLASGRSDFVDASFASQTIQITGNVAIVRHRLTGAINDGGVPGKVDLQVLLVWKKYGKHWRLLARQAIRKPS